MSDVPEAEVDTNGDEDALLDWVEGQAAENMRFHVESLAVISKEANTTLTVLLAGVGAASAYTVKLFDTHGAGWLLAATITFGVCLLLLSAWLILGCLKISELPTPTNEPENLYQPKYSLSAIRAAEITNTQSRIHQVVRRNNKTADRLNRIRLLALLTPVIASVAAGVVAAVGVERHASECSPDRGVPAAAVGLLAYPDSLVGLRTVFAASGEAG
ncbi:hypothetical protein AB4Y43_07040 [Paraburkholderia sp. BR10872]|uniref:hypothetical protein n=1 Tax=Paraburkholderia sp. BR10872 TaxID=3236989 RepID=UPI0034D2F27F